MIKNRLLVGRQCFILDGWLIYVDIWTRTCYRPHVFVILDTFRYLEVNEECYSVAYFRVICRINGGYRKSCSAVLLSAVTCRVVLGA